MTANGWLQIAIFLGVILLAVKPLGWYMALVYEGRPCGLDRVLGPLERRLYALYGREATAEMTWKTYAIAMLLFNFAGLVFLYVLQRVQGWLPLNPVAFGAVSPDSSFNTAVSFASNTNWQGYGGESTMSYLTQMLGLTVQNFVSAATGMACLVALIRGFVRHSARHIGNFWVDLTRSTLYILLPLAIVLALLLVSQGVVQTLGPYKTVPLVQATGYEEPQQDAAGQPLKDEAGNAVTRHVPVTQQVLATGPAASQVAIKQLGTNGGGFFNTNSAHPFENPTPLSNFLEMLGILLIPAALCYTFGRMVGDTRQGWALLAVMVLLYVPFQVACYWAETRANPALARLSVDQSAGDSAEGPAPALACPGGNMEGKETRFGIAASANWAVATTCASNGSVNSMHDSYMPLGGLAPMVLMQLGEVIFGGVGSGLYGLLMFAVIAVFVAGLMVGRTPEYLGKKIEAYEMKMASITALAPHFAVLLGAAVAVVTIAGRAGVLNPGPHGFSEILYAYSSAGNNNGSAFAGLSANTPFYNLTLGLSMLVSRYWTVIPVLAIAGSLVKKKKVPVSAGTMPTHSALFVVLLTSVVIIVGALVFLPALALGPIVEHLSLMR
jgi:potassium-transporting ATPase potassium-binding subunit